MLAAIVTGCAGLTAGIKGAHTTVSKTVDSAFNFVEKAADTGEKILGSATSGAKDTATTVTTATP